MKFKRSAKRLLSVFASAAILSTLLPVGAAASAGGTTDSYKIDIYKPRDKDVEHPADFTLRAYQIFSGSVKSEPAENHTSATNKPTFVDGKGTITGEDDSWWDETPGTSNTALSLTDIKWGKVFDRNTNNTIDGDEEEDLNKYIKALYDSKSKYEDLKTAFSYLGDYYSGDDLDSKYNYNFVANKIAETLANEKYSKNRKFLQHFSEITFANINETYKKVVAIEGEDKWNHEDDTKNVGIKNGTDPVWTFDVSAGYYLISDETNVVGLDIPYEKSAYMLFVAGNVVQTLKSSVPAIEKDIIRKTEGNSEDTLKETEVAGVGDIVEFILRGSLPSNFDKFNKYTYIFNDTFSPALDLVGHDEQPVTTETVSDKIVVSAHGFWYSKTTNKPENTSEWTWISGADYDLPIKTETTPGYEAKYTVEDDIHVLSVSFEDLRAIQIQLSTENPLKDSKGNPLKDSEGNEYTTGYIRLGYNYNDIIDSPENSIHGAVDLNSSTIRVLYKAKVNEKAVVNPASTEPTGDKNGNKNEATITYSNNITDETSTDETTVDTAHVYTLGLDLLKKDYAKSLEGEGEALNDAKFAFLRKAKDNDDKEIWQIADIADYNSPVGTDVTDNYKTVYEWVNLTADDGSNVESTTTGDALTTAVKNFIKEKNGKPSTTDSSHITDFEIQSKNEGHLYLTGLDNETTYTVVETQLPNTEEGKSPYVQLDPFEIALKAKTIAGAGTVELEYDGLVGETTVTKEYGAEIQMSIKNYVQNLEVAGSDDNGIAAIDVVNFKYVDLPSTGGSGVYIYYIAGGALIAGAVVLLVVSKRKRSKTE